MAKPTTAPESKGDLPKGTTSGFYTVGGKEVVIVVVEIDHDTSKAATDKGNVTIGHYREDMVGSNGKTYTLSGMAYRHDRKK